MHVLDVTNVSAALDFEQIASFQKHCFGIDWVSPERGRLQCPAYYRWKYFAPAGAACLASIRSKRELLAMIAAVPFWMAGSGNKFRAWQICDIATHPNCREQGLFSKCLSALRETLAGEMMFCFPNEHSRRRLVREGFSVQTKLQLRARPVPLHRKGDSQIEFDLSNFPAELDRTTDKELQLHIIRSPEFLQWRYSSHPVIKYTGIITPTPRTVHPQALAFLRTIDLVGLRLCLIVESWPSSENGLRLAINAALQWANKNRCCALLSAGGQPTTTSTLKSFWCIRGWKMSKSISFCATEPPFAHEGASSWGLQLGDWDAV
jgi:Acetyltransferase (GNAT) domain